MTFVIEDGVPAPTRRRHTRGITATALQLQVGQSFVVPGAKILTSAIGRLNVRLSPARFASRTVEGGVRIWRIA